MDNKKSKIVPLCIGVLAFSVLFCAAIYAWTEPSAAPTGGSINAPINTGSTAQTKSGGLNIASATGNVGIGTTSPAAKLDIETGNGTSGLKTGLICSNATTSKLYTDTNGNIVCGTDQGGGGAGFDPSSYPCSGIPLPASGAIKNKRMFVTSGTYRATDFATGGYGYNSSRNMTTSDETKADAKCQTLASAAGFTGGTFKALVYMGNRDISNVVPGGSVFWSCDRMVPKWNQVAQGSSDLFTNKSGNYLNNQIHDEFGNLSGATVWTGFEASIGGYNLLSKFNAGLHNIPAASGSLGYEIGWWGSCINGRLLNPNCGWMCDLSAVAWYGVANSVSSAWAHAGTFNEYRYSDNQFISWNNCASLVQRALYCIEQ